MRAMGSGESAAVSRSTALARVDARWKLLALVAYMLVVFNVGGWPALGACAAAAAACSLAARLRPRTLVRAIVPFSAVLVFTAAMQVLCWSGTVLFCVGGLSVTAEALDASAAMTVRLACAMAASLAFTACTTTSELSRAFARLLRPFECLGLRTGGLVFALDVAFAFIPVLVDEFRAVKRAQEARLADFDAGGVRGRLAAYQRVFAPVFRNAMRRADQLAEAAVARAWGA